MLITRLADVAGESIRKNIVEKEPGIPLFVDLAIYDTTTCEPIPDIWVEIWGKSLDVFY